MALGSTSRLAPGLLLAAPQLGDPNFERTVVLLGRHDADGAVGWVINGRALPPVGELLRSSQIVAADDRLPDQPAFARPARVGGPVQPAAGYLLYARRRGVEITSELTIGDSLGICSDPDVLARVVRGELLDDFRLLLGYAGWGPGQLEGKIRAGGWLPAPLDVDLVLGDGDEETWERAYRRISRFGSGAFVPSRGGSA